MKLSIMSLLLKALNLSIMALLLKALNVKSAASGLVRELSCSSQCATSIGCERVSGNTANASSLYGVWINHQPMVGNVLVRNSKIDVVSFCDEAI